MTFKWTSNSEDFHFSKVDCTCSDRKCFSLNLFCGLHLTNTVQLKYVFLFVCLFVWADQRYKVSCTWEDRSVHSAWPSSWTVTDFTPDRITFLAISTPRPRIPAIRTSVVPIRCIASWPRTYLCEQQVDLQHRLYRTGKGDPLVSVWKYLQLPGVETLIDVWHVARVAGSLQWKVWLVWVNGSNQQ